MAIAGGVQGSFLVTVFAVAQRLLAMQDQAFGGRESFAFGLTRKVFGDRFVVAGGVLERLAHQLAASRGLSTPLFGDFLKNASILIWTADDGNEIIVLGSGTNQAWTADVNLLDCFVLQNVRASDGGGERVEVDDDKLERRNSVFFQRLHIARVITTSQNTRKNFRVQRFDSAIHHFWKLRIFGNVDHRDPRQF